MLAPVVLQVTESRVYPIALGLCFTVQGVVSVVAGVVTGVCVCVCERERERESVRVCRRERESLRVCRRERERVIYPCRGFYRLHVPTFLPTHSLHP